MDRKMRMTIDTGARMKDEGRKEEEEGGRRG
jgi:hypothetical protein